MNGAITNGLKWMFFSYTPGPDGVGGTFNCSIQLVAESADMRAVITGILRDMVRVQDVACGVHSMTCICRLILHQRWPDCLSASLLHLRNRELDGYAVSFPCNPRLYSRPFVPCARVHVDMHTLFSVSRNLAVPPLHVLSLLLCCIALQA